MSTTRRLRYGQQLYVVKKKKKKNPRGCSTIISHQYTQTHRGRVSRPSVWFDEDWTTVLAPWWQEHEVEKSTVSFFLYEHLILYLDQRCPSSWLLFHDNLWYANWLNAFPRSLRMWNWLTLLFFFSADFPADLVNHSDPTRRVTFIAK